MQKASNWLLDHASDTYSQAGEDGVIAAILSLIGAPDRWCVEFGAWDGLHLSNTRRLISEQGYSAVLIEGDRAKWNELKRNYADNPRVSAVNAMVGFRAEDGLDSILSRCDIPRDFDFLSIDIDGNDYHVWKRVEAYRPKVVCVEFNPSMPNEVHFVQPADPRVKQGASLSALADLAREKRYELVCALHANAFFVDSPYFARFGIADNSPARVRQNLSTVTWLFSGFDGTVHLAGHRYLPWHGIELRERAMQSLPRLLRKFPDDYSKVRSVLFRALRKWRSLRNPRKS